MSNPYSYTITAPGVTVTTVASTSANGALPVDAAGNRPRRVRVAATGTAYVMLAPNVGAAVATTSRIMVGSGSATELLVLGMTHYAVIDDGVSVKVNISPCDD